MRNKTGRMISVRLTPDATEALRKLLISFSGIMPTATISDVVNKLILDEYHRQFPKEQSK